jgi:hypothetical protein
MNEARQAGEELAMATVRVEMRGDVKWRVL